MPNPLKDFFFGAVQQKKELVEAIAPRKTFDDVIVTEATRRALNNALVQIKKHDLIFQQWGLGERHSTGRGLAFNFAGPPGTGKTICAEAIAHALGKKLLVVRYSEMESLWAGETGKNVAAVFHSAREQDAVLFFDEADAIAGRRFASVTQGYQREANTVVNVLLKELEDFDGVVIFATNLAANFDPAFERRIRTHVLFEMPDASTRERIWKVQLHSKKTPLAPDVDFKKLAEKFDNVSGGDIKNAVLKAAQMATLEEGTDAEKRIHQKHFESGMQDVIAAKKVMEQSIYEGDGSHRSSEMNRTNSSEWQSAMQQLIENQQYLDDNQSALLARLESAEETLESWLAQMQHLGSATRESSEKLRADYETLRSHLDAFGSQHETLQAQQETLRAEYSGWREEANAQWQEARGSLETKQREFSERLAHLTTQLEAAQSEKTALATRVASAEEVAKNSESAQAKMLTEMDATRAQLVSHATQTEEWKNALQRQMRSLQIALIAGAALLAAVILMMALRSL